MQRISRDDLRGHIDAGGITPIEALPEAHYDAERLPTPEAAR